MLPLSKKKKKTGSPSKAGEQGGTPLEAYNPASLWQTGPFSYPDYQPVYPGMVSQYHAVQPLQNVMRIGECSIKPVGQ